MKFKMELKFNKSATDLIVWLPFFLSKKNKGEIKMFEKIASMIAPILNGGKKIEIKNEEQKESRPCPMCGEELERMDKCLECRADLTYHNGICYAVDWSETL